MTVRPASVCRYFRSEPTMAVQATVTAVPEERAGETYVLAKPRTDRSHVLGKL